MKPQFIPDTKQKWLQITGIVYKQQDTAVRFQVGEVLNKKNVRESLRLMILEGEIFLICFRTGVSRITELTIPVSESTSQIAKDQR